MIERFFLMLKETIEQHSKLLRRGKAFLPEYLRGKKLAKKIFPKVAESLTSSLGLELATEVRNPMPKGYNVMSYNICKIPLGSSHGLTWLGMRSWL